MKNRLILAHPLAPDDIHMFGTGNDGANGAPWLILRDRLRAMGIEIATTWERPDAVEQADCVWLMNVPEELRPGHLSFRTLARTLRRAVRRQPRLNVWQRLEKASRTDRAVLFLWEPEVVIPENYSEVLHHRFARILTWKADLIERGDPYRPLVYPQQSNTPATENPPFERRKLLVNFSGNKTSSHHLELYGARREVIRYMERHHPEDFDHYGPGWSRDFPSWQGTVESKFTVYPHYRFGLCFENMHSVCGYITEKILDCLRAGTVPVYWGSPDIGSAVDEAAFVDRRRFSDTGEMIRFLRDMEKSRWEDMRAAGQAYLASERFARFLPDAFCDTILRGVGLLESDEAGSSTAAPREA